MAECVNKILDFDSVCRLCLYEKRVLVDIFDYKENNSELNIIKMIKGCAAIDLQEGDGLPARICVPCLTSLNSAFDFRLQCENADKTLREIYEVLKSKNHETSEVPVNKKQLVNKEEAVHISSQAFIDNFEVQRATEQSDILFAANDEETNPEIDDNFVNEVFIKDDGDLLSDNLFLYKDIKKCNETVFSIKDNCNKNMAEKKWDRIEETEKKNMEVQKSKCPFCQKVLTRVNEHIRLLHRNKVYICKKANCGAEFSTLKNLQSHQLKCYNMKKPFRCLKCFKEFYRKCNYKSHVIRHSGKKNFQCQLCDSAFVDTTGLKRHFFKHHEPFRETFTSGCCNKKFKSKEGLRLHIKKGVCGVHVLQNSP